MNSDETEDLSLTKENTTYPVQESSGSRTTYFQNSSDHRQRTNGSESLYAETKDHSDVGKRNRAETRNTRTYGKAPDAGYKSIIRSVLNTAPQDDERDRINGAMRNHV